MDATIPTVTATGAAAVAGHQQTVLEKLQRQTGSALATPEITGGDVGGQMSDGGNETVIKGEDSGHEVTTRGLEEEPAVKEEHHQALETLSGPDYDMARTGSTALPMDKGDGGEGRQHHLLRHSLSPEERGAAVLSHFGVETVADAAKQIKKMSQRDLQAKFKAVYGTKTFSNNNNWLRRKLFEAIGMDPGKSATKKATQTGPRRRRATLAMKATSITATRKTRPPLRYARRTKAEMEEEQNHVAEALLALADFACEEEIKEEKPVHGGYSDCVVPGRDDVSEGGLSWSSRGRDVPISTQQEPIKDSGIQLPVAPPLSADYGQEAMMTSMMEYFSMMQRMMMQSPENQHMLMAMMNGQQGPQSQPHMFQQLQHMQQLQQMQMLMALQSNPGLLNSLAAGCPPQEPMPHSCTMNSGSGHSPSPSLFMGQPGTDS
jgi:hypothetical protein